MKTASIFLWNIFITLLLAAKFTLAGVYVLFREAGLTMPLALAASENNTIDADLKLDVILDTFLEALNEELLPLSAFSTDFSGAVTNEGETVKVGYIPAAAAARDFNGTYTVQKSDYQKKEVTIDAHKYVSWGLADVDLFKGSIVNLQSQARQKAQSLAAQVLADILSLITLDNYGVHAFVGAANTFDLDDVADLRTKAVKAKWPKGSRRLLLGADYYGNVVKENVFQDAAAAGGTSTRETGNLPNLYTFVPYETESLPDNDEHLVGAMCMPSAIAVAMRYLAPRRPEKYLDSRAITHPQTGITYGFRQDYDTKTGVESYIFECNYGKSVLEGAALQRLVSEV